MRSTLFCLLAATMLAPLPALAQDPTRMDTVIRTDADKGEFMGAVLVVKDGKVLLDRGYGSANLEWKLPNDGDTKFRLASVTKQFTAVSILLLHERGKLDLDAPIKAWFSDAPAAWDKVTIRHLLLHTSGVPNFTSFPDYRDSKTLPATLDTLIARFRDKPLDFQPGEKMNYSNSGYVLLTAIIEKASGQGYAAFVAENIFEPLGMADSGYDSFAAVIPRRAAGYVPSPKGPANAPYLDMTIPQGAGALYSTTHDLVKWTTGLFGGKLLKPETLAVMLTPVQNDYGMGIIIVRKDGMTMYQHSGGIEGFNTWLGYDPDRKITVVVLGNLNGGAPGRLGGGLMTLARGGSVILPSERVGVALPARTLAAYPGTYQVSPEFGLTVRLDGGKLTVQATGQDAFELFAEKPDHFFLKAVDAQLQFRRDANGKIDAAILKQNGREMVAVRK